MAKGEGNQFSIYKIDYDEVEKHHTITFSKNSDYVGRVRDFLIEEIKRKINKRPKSEIIVVEKGNFKGIIYKTCHCLEWKDMAIDLLINTSMDMIECEKWLDNINISYVLMYVYEDDIYAMTGGFGNHVIKNYIEKNWGLYLIPKLVQKDSVIIRQLKENNMYGNTSMISKANRKTTNFSLEQDMSTIFRELAVELGQEIGSKLGIKYDEHESVNKKTGVILKDSLVIRKKYSLAELEGIIEKLREIEQEEDKFSLGYFVSAKKKGIKSSELVDELINYLLENKLDNFQLVGDDYLSYYMIASEYTLLTDMEGPYYTSAEPIKLEDIFDVFQEDEKKLSKRFLLSFLKKWKISAQDANGEDVLLPTPIIDAIQGFVEHGENGIPCYIFRGQWYCMDEQYTQILNNEFNNIYEGKLVECEHIKTQYGLRRTCLTENEYNNTFFTKENVIVGHKALISNFEIADLIFWDDKYVYLMCNKKHFDGSSSRDLTNQIWASSCYFQRQMQSLQKTNFMENWYLKIEELYLRENAKMPVTNQEFQNIFNERGICYIAGYLTGFSQESESLYGKYLTVDLFKRMYANGFELISMNIQ